jgi:hypothetical protein
MSRAVPGVTKQYREIPSCLREQCGRAYISGGLAPEPRRPRRPNQVRSRIALDRRPEKNPGPVPQSPRYMNGPGPACYAHRSLWTSAESPR